MTDIESEIDCYSRSILGNPSMPPLNRLKRADVDRAIEAMNEAGIFHDIYEVTVARGCIVEEPLPANVKIIRK